MRRWRLYLAAGAFLLAGLSGISRLPAQSTPAPSIGQQMDDFWQGKAHFEEVGNLDWTKPPYNSPSEGWGWFGNPMPFPGGTWYLFNRQWQTKEEKPAYCPKVGWRIVVRESTDQGRSWSNPAVLAATPRPESAPDACGVVDGSSYYDRDTNTWHMLAQCLAAHYAGGWMMCHYVRSGPSPMGPFTPDATPSVRGGQLWSQICSRSRGICDPQKTKGEGTPDIVYKKNGYWYVTFHGFDDFTKHGFRGVAKTADFHHWITSGPNLPNGPIFASPECQAWNPGCIGGGEASTLIAGNYQYMMIETPTISLACTPGQTWPIALLRAPKDTFPAWSSPLWQRFHANPLLTTSWPGPKARCSIQYQRWAVAGSDVYILYEDFDPKLIARASARPLLKLLPGGGPPVSLAAPAPRSQR
jgi:hypothetical protein